ncbi:MAG: hypothetical protein AAFV62_05960, partial [Pseudomonadota bacterium]
SLTPERVEMMRWAMSAALATHAATAPTLLEAARRAKTYTSGAIARADDLKVGGGHGPTHHFHALWCETV